MSNLTDSSIAPPPAMSPPPPSMLWPYLSLGIQALLPIIVGSRWTLEAPRPPRPTTNSSAIPSILDPDDPYSGRDSSSSEESSSSSSERLSLTDSLLFPLIGSVALGGLYFALKVAGQVWVNRVMGAYFALAGVAAFQTTSSRLLSSLYRRLGIRRGRKYHLRLELGFKELLHIPFSRTQLVLLPISILLPATYLLLPYLPFLPFATAGGERPWILSNTLAFSFATQAITLLRLESFVAGAALLGGLFVYDVFWVFGTPVMVTVAQGLDAPIKILAPRDLGDASAGYSMLGLGDIVIPGIFISLALRYDFARYVAKRKAIDSTSSSSSSRGTESLASHPSPRDVYPRTFFSAVLAAYILGLATTVLVMHHFQAAQPALLYLSPACVGAVALVAAVQGELKEVWKWSDGEDDDDEQTEQEVLDVDALPDATVDERYLTGKATLVADEEDDSWMRNEDEQDKQPRRRKAASKGKRK